MESIQNNIFKKSYYSKHQWKNIKVLLTVLKILDRNIVYTHFAKNESLVAIIQFIDKYNYGVAILVQNYCIIIK